MSWKVTSATGLVQDRPRPGVGKGQADDVDELGGIQRMTDSARTGPCEITSRAWGTTLMFVPSAPRAQSMARSPTPRTTADAVSRTGSSVIPYDTRGMANGAEVAGERDVPRTSHLRSVLSVGVRQQVGHDQQEVEHHRQHCHERWRLVTSRGPPARPSPH